MMEMVEIVQRSEKPKPWAEGEKIPWNDPEFSHRMLREHLSQEHDWASRKMASIDQHVDWIRQQIPARGPARVLDLGCGPGLYTSRLAGSGQECVGIDFSPASIEYARTFARNERLPCSYSQEDIRQADFGVGYGMVMFVYGELNVFHPQDADLILAKTRASLCSGGALVLEVHSYEAVHRMGLQPPSWYSAESGLFSSRPHLCLEEHFWDAEQSVATTRYYIMDARTREVTRYASSTQAYTQDEYLALLKKAGFQKVETFPSLTGKVDPTQGDFFVLLAHK